MIQTSTQKIAPLRIFENLRLIQMLVINDTYKCVVKFWAFMKANILFYLLSITKLSGVLKFSSMHNANENAISKLRKNDLLTRLQNAPIKPSARPKGNRNPASSILQVL